MGKKKHKQKKRKEKSRVPLHDTHQAVHFLYFCILGEEGEIEGNNMRKIMKEQCPNTTHGEEAQT